ncbi:hypothetical protein [Kitasatospora sp. NPDC093102]|uniref:hypothetical protein n=1 Tax=Kitasatospora sp. NPDC093102 TaxID=3155069 RepID=UPI0034210D1B
MQSLPLGGVGSARALGRAYLSPSRLIDVGKVLTSFNGRAREYTHTQEADERYYRRVLGPFPTPWADGPEPYFLLADRNLSLTGEHGEAVPVHHDEFAALAASDPALKALPKDVPVVLLAPHGGSGGLELPRAIATRTDRTVYALTAGLQRTPNPDGDWSFGLKTPRWTDEGPAPQGGIVRVDPPSLGGVDPALGDSGGHLTTVRGKIIPDREIHTQTIVEPLEKGLRGIGRASFNGPDWVIRERIYGRFNGVTHYSYARGRRTRPAGPVPWNPENAYFFSAHGGRRGFSLRTEHGTEVTVDGSELGGFLRRRPSVQALKNAPASDSRSPSIVLHSCNTAQHAQAVADETGLVVHAPNRNVWTYTRGGSSGHAPPEPPLVYLRTPWQFWAPKALKPLIRAVFPSKYMEPSSVAFQTFRPR